ncbi:DUF5956 family protein [Arthrobacter sp. TmT3-37]
MTEQAWNQVRESARLEGWTEATANGWGALIAWVAGPANTCRAPAAVRHRHTEVLVMTDGIVVRQPSLLSDDDLASIDDDIDTYLAAAGVPPLPRCYAWFIRRPAQCDTDAAFWSAINQGVQEAAPDAVEPLELRLVVDGVLRALYS